MGPRFHITACVIQAGLSHTNSNMSLGWMECFSQHHNLNLVLGKTYSQYLAVVSPRESIIQLNGFKEGLGTKWHLGSI